MDVKAENFRLCITHSWIHSVSLAVEFIGSENISLPQRAIMCVVSKPKGQTVNTSKI